MLSFFAKHTELLSKGISNFKQNTKYLMTSIGAVIVSSVLPTASACHGFDIKGARFSVNTNAIYGNNIIEESLVEKIVTACKAKAIDTCHNSCHEGFFAGILTPLHCQPGGHSAYGFNTYTLVASESIPFDACAKNVLAANSPSGFGSNWGDYFLTAVIVGTGLTLICCAKNCYLARRTGAPLRQHNEFQAANDLSVSLIINDHAQPEAISTPSFRR